tara:strand:+ start:350 stop:556 length:207 start_codon:yes stop_codon:yes gene_type:complete
MGGGVGFKNLKSSVNIKNKIYSIVVLINSVTIANQKFDVSIIDSQFFEFKSDDYLNHIIKNFGRNIIN